jgi:small subunit ribosomal protein S7
MPRRRRPDKRKIAPDPRYGSDELSRFINKVMMGGKKTTAQRIVYEAMDLLEEETKQSPLDVFRAAMQRSTPQLEVKPRRVGGATYQVPIEVRSTRREALGMRWLVNSARARTGKPMSEKLYEELLDASRGQGAAVKRREDLHRMADANKAFVHYKW